MPRMAVICGLLAAMLAIGCAGPALRTEETEPKPVTIHLTFYTREGCVATPEMRENLQEALKSASYPYEFEEVDMGELEESDVRTAYGTPTLLVDGMDLMGRPEPEEPQVPT